MRYYKFRVDAFYPPEYREKFYDILDKEKKIEKLDYQYVLEESAPPLEMLKDIVMVLAPTLTILKILYDFSKEIRKKKGKVYVSVSNQQIDLEAHHIDEIKVKFGKPVFKPYKIHLSVPTLEQNEIKKAARTLSFRPISFNNVKLSSENTVLFADYNEESKMIEAVIHIRDDGINSLYEKGTAIYAMALPKKIHENTPLEQILFTELLLTTKFVTGSSKISEC